MNESAAYRVQSGFEQEWRGSSAIATEVVLNVIRVGEAVTARVEAFVREHGLPSATALLVLEILRGEGAPLTPSVIAERSIVSRPALSGVLATLERRRLIRRWADPDDRRRVMVEITKEGVDSLERLLPDLHRAEVAWTEGLRESQKADLVRNLGRLQAHLNARDR